MLNELPGIARNKHNRLYLTTANGNIGSKDLNKVKEVDTELLKLLQTPAGLVSYTHQTVRSNCFMHLSIHSIIVNLHERLHQMRNTLFI
jgi:hypothetical protein